MTPERLRELARGIEAYIRDGDTELTNEDLQDVACLLRANADHQQELVFVSEIFQKITNWEAKDL